jgi:peptidoglycan/LPS O-acetylase OafA/YrhL
MLSTGIPKPIPNISFAMNYIAGGNTGVTLFFVLSGFLLSLPFISGLKNKTYPSVVDYAVSRALRIIPLYYIVVIGSIIYSGQLENGIKALAFDYVGFSIFPFSVVWWTLSTEVQFYFILPLLMLLLRSNLGIIILIVIVIIWAASYYHFTLNSAVSNLDIYSTKSLFARFPAFALGIDSAYVYSLYTSINYNPIVRIRLAATIALVATIITLGLVLTAAVNLGGKSETTWHLHHSYEALCWSVIMLILVTMKPFGKGLFINAFNAFIGKISYSIYLIHFPIIFYICYPIQQQFEPHEFLQSSEAIWVVLLSFSATIFFSYLSYVGIERPFLKIKQHIPTYRKK